MAMFLMSCILYLYIWLQSYDFSMRYDEAIAYFFSFVSSLLKADGVTP